MLPRMKPCSISTRIMPTTSSGPEWVTNSNVSGAANSRNVPACASRLAESRRGEVVGVRDEHAPPQRRALHQRVVHRHDRDDVAEGDGELGDARPEPDGELHRLAAGDPVPRQQKADDHGEVMLDARGEQDRLVAEPTERQQDDDRDELRRADRRRDERAQQRGDERGVERDVEPGARRAAEAAAGSERAPAWSSPGAGSGGTP